jgi:Bax protein
VVNPLLGIAYPGFSSWLALAAASAGLDVNTSEPAPGTANQAWYRAGLGTVINPLLHITYPGSLAWLAPPEPDAAPDQPRLMPFAMFSALAPASSASWPAAGAASPAQTIDAWLTGKQASTEGFLNEAFAEAVRLGAMNYGAGNKEPVFELGPYGALHVRFGSAQALALYFEDADYDLALVRDGLELVPRRYVASLPPDLEAIESADERKQLFIKAVLPVILRVNEEIETARRRAESLAEAVKRGDALKFADRLWLDAQYARYEVGAGEIDELLNRIDVIPPSLAIAQAAEESGWGTSRFAREGNALYGQYTHPDGPGIEPMSEEAIGRYRIRSYDSLYETVRSYALNLNHHKAYEKFRALRAELRGAAAPLDGHKLAGTLTRYSERGKAYIKTIRVIMKENGLRHFDGVRLHDRAIRRLAEQAGDGSS